MRLYVQIPMNIIAHGLAHEVFGDIKMVGQVPQVRMPCIYGVEQLVLRDELFGRLFPDHFPGGWVITA